MIEKLNRAFVKKLFLDNCSTPLVTLVKPTLKGETYSTYGGGERGNVIISSSKVILMCPCNGFEKQELSKDSMDRCICPLCNQGFNSWQRRAKVILSADTIKDAEKKHSELNKKDTYRYYAGNYIVKFGGFQNSSDGKPKSREKLLQTYYVKEKLDGTCGIDIVRLTINAVANNGDITFEEKYDKWCEVVPGQKIAAYKFTKARGQEEIDIFDAFHITSDNVTNDECVYFEGATSMIDFIANNPDFAKRTGLDELVMNYLPTSLIPENSLFLLYLYLYSKYPVVELLVKMKYYGLVFGLMEKICSAYRREDIKASVSSLNKLLNQTSKGSASLSIPSYIGQYLNAKGARIDEYFSWVALNEYESISKENFEKIIASEAYWYINYYNLLGQLPNIIKYGYTLNQVTKYIMKQYMGDGKWSICQNKVDYRTPHPISSIISLWKDYLEHCELMDIKPDKFPQDVKKAHDDIMTAYKAIEDKMVDKELATIADKYSSYKTTSKHYDVVVPRSVNDFVTEGNNQHNCVGGYVERVRKGMCRVFFIRKIDDMETSYITAECSKSGTLAQIKYRNNISVTNYDEVEYAKAFCKFIMSKGW